MVFEYKPRSLDIVENIWMFSVPSIGLTTNFVVVGHTLDPAVLFDRTYLSFKTVLLGMCVCICVYVWYVCMCVC